MDHLNEPAFRPDAEQHLPNFQVSQAEVTAFARRIKPLSGGALKILLMMLVTRRAFSKKELHLSIGIAYATIRRALRQLEEVGAVMAVGDRNYRLSKKWWEEIVRLILASRMAQLGEYYSSSGNPRSRPKERNSGQFGRLSQDSDGLEQPGEGFNQPVVIDVQPVEPSYQAGEWSGQAAARSGQVGNQSVRTTTVVVEDLSEKEKRNINIQQQQSFQTKKVIPGNFPRDDPDRNRQRTKHSDHLPVKAGQSVTDNARDEGNGPPIDDRLPATGEDGPNPEIADHGLDRDYFDPALEPARAAGRENKEQEESAPPKTPSRPPRRKLLASYLRRAGILGKAYRELLERPDLQLDPRPVLAWWWYALAQEGIRQPAALAIRFLQRRDPAPTGYLELVSLWRRIKPNHRVSMEEMVQRNWSAEEMARHWANAYPEGSDKAFIALKELYMAHPEVLGF